jgi:hypothetical protein
VSPFYYQPIVSSKTARSFYGLYVTARSIGTVRLASFGTTCKLSPEHDGGFSAGWVSSPPGIFNLIDSFTIEIVYELDDGFDACQITGCPAGSLLMRGVTD